MAGIRRVANLSSFWVDEIVARAPGPANDVRHSLGCESRSPFSLTQWRCLFWDDLKSDSKFLQISAAVLTAQLGRCTLRVVAHTCTGAAQLSGHNMVSSAGLWSALAPDEALVLRGRCADFSVPAHV